MIHKLPTLSFKYDALEPFIDAQTMEIHHSKHHQGYVNKLNDAIKGTAFEDASLEEIFKSVSELPDGIRNNAGGHYNHSLFWEILSPEGRESPEGKLSEVINQTFGSLHVFKTQFADAAAGQFGSGWAWLIVKEGGTLKITSTPNQDNPLMDVTEIQGSPILGLDVWEHAYYLHYQNRRPDYISAFWNVVDWEAVEEKYFESLKEAV